MATATPNFPQTPRSPISTILEANASNNVEVLTAPAAGARIDMIGVSSTDGTARDVTFTVSDGTNDGVSWTVTIPITAGNIAGTKAVNALNRTVCPFLNDDGALWLSGGYKLYWKALTTVSTGKALKATAFVGDWA